MGKNKFKRFQENLTFGNLVQPVFEEIFHRDHVNKGSWREKMFGNDNPVVLELGCGRGEYTVALGQMYPDKNFIGIDIKGARIWRGAKTAWEEGMKNVAFLRTRIEFINSFFGPDEIDEIWITFPDPQLKKNRVKKRLTSPIFLGYYAQFLKPDGIIHLKTDCRHLHDYTLAVAEANGLDVPVANNDIYGSGYADRVLSIKTKYEEMFLERGFPITYLVMKPEGRKDFTPPYFQPDEELGIDKGEAGTAK